MENENQIEEIQGNQTQLSKLCTKCGNTFIIKYKFHAYCHPCTLNERCKYRENKRDQDYICECGVLVSYLSKWLHFKTKRHIARMEKIEKLKK